MTVRKLTYLGQKTHEKLLESIGDNLDRYLHGDFEDLRDAGDWDLPLSIDINTSLLDNLVAKSGVEAEVKNSLTIWNALPNMPPALACEGRLWARLTHIECLEYSRERWLVGVPNERIEKAVRTHFFATTQTGWRDDCSISRLWWNAYIAHRSHPEDIERVLKILLKTADIRSNFIERSWIASRRPLARRLIDFMIGDDWVTTQEINFRETMKAINLLGGGISFESIPDNEISAFITRCKQTAQSRVANS